MATTRDTVWIDVLVMLERELAVLVQNGHREAWIPKSLILDEEDEIGTGVETRIELPAWLAEEKDLI